MLIGWGLMVPSKAMENSASRTPRLVRTLISTTGPMALNLCVLSSNWRLFRRYFCSTNLVRHDGPEVTCSSAKFLSLDHRDQRGKRSFPEEKLPSPQAALLNSGAGTGGWDRGLEFLEVRSLGFYIVRLSLFHSRKTLSFTLQSLRELRLNTDDGAACKTWELSCYFS